MKITKEKLQELKACEDGIEWYIKNGSEDLLETLVKVNDYNPEYARWLFTRLMTREQNIKIAVYAAELVLPLFETEHPSDLRPRKAIKAAKAVLKNDTEHNRRAAISAASDAYAASAAASAAAAAYAAASAARAASAASAAFASDYAAASAAASHHATAHAAASAARAASKRKEVQLKIIAEAVRLLDKE